MSSSRYFLSKILDNVGIHDNKVKNEINLAMTCWGFVNATVLALTVPKMKRRTVFLVRRCDLLQCFVLTNWFSGLYGLPHSHLHWLDHCQCAIRHRRRSSLVSCSHCVRHHQRSLGRCADAVACRFIFLYSPAYNCGFNALTYGQQNLYLFL